MLEDAARYQQLVDQQAEEASKFRAAQTSIFEEHTVQVNMKRRDHQELVKIQNKAIQDLKDQIETLEQDNAETLRQIMQDAHDEKVAIAEKNRTALKNVKDMGLMSTAELQNKKNKLQDLKAETELVERQIKDKGQQLENQKKLTEEKQTQALENLQEIHNQDNKIAFRERSILYLKKKTQELEKFKFVLDYKIKDLRRDIAPREMEIVTLKQRTNSMDKELRRYNDLNASLGFMVDDLRTRQETLQEHIKRARDTTRKNEAFVNGFKNAVYTVVQYIDDYDQLKRSVNNHLYKYIQDQGAKNVEVDPDIKKEYENQKKYLKNSVHSLEKRLEMEKNIHKEDNMRIMNGNQELIDCINVLRASVQAKDREFKKKKNELKELAPEALKPEAGEGSSLSPAASHESLADQ